MYGVDAFSGRASDERDRLGQVGVASGETHRDRTAHEWPTTTTRCQVGVEAPCRALLMVLGIGCEVDEWRRGPQPVARQDRRKAPLPHRAHQHPARANLYITGWENRQFKRRHFRSWHDMHRPVARLSQPRDEPDLDRDLLPLASAWRHGHRDPLELRLARSRKSAAQRP